MTCKSVVVGLMLFAAACGNYSNEDLEYMNAVPARVDIAAVMPRSLILPANEAELSRLTHDVVGAFNKMLDFLDAADFIRTFQPTGRIPNGRVWGPIPMDDHPGWQWHFVITRDPAAPEMFSYAFEVQPIGAGTTWTPFIDGSFVATGGVRKGMGHFHIGTDALRAANFTLDYSAKGELLKDLDVMYSTAAFPISVRMSLAMYPNGLVGDFANTTRIDYHYEAQENGQGAMEFSGADSESGATISVESRWLATGRGRADAMATDGINAGATWSQCWDDSFRATYNNKTWATTPGENFGDPAADCPAISTL